MSETTTIKEWDIQRRWPNNWQTAGYNITGRQDGKRVIERIRKNQPSVTFRLVKITVVKTIEEIA